MTSDHFRMLKLGESFGVRLQIVAEVRRAPMRRVDNMITRLYDSARLLRMHAVVMNTIKKDYTAEGACSGWQQARGRVHD